MFNTTLRSHLTESQKSSVQKQRWVSFYRTFNLRYPVSLHGAGSKANNLFTISRPTFSESFLRSCDQFTTWWRQCLTSLAQFWASDNLFCMSRTFRRMQMTEIINLHNILRCTYDKWKRIEDPMSSDSQDPFQNQPTEIVQLPSRLYGKNPWKKDLA